VPDGSNYTQVWMKLFQLPNTIKAVRISQMILIVCKFKWSIVNYPNWNEAVWSSPKVNKALRSYPNLNEDIEDVPLGPGLYETIAIWPELI